MIRSYDDIKTAYDDERFKNERIESLRKQDIYNEYKELKDIDFSLIDLYVNLTLDKKIKQQKIDELKIKKAKFLKDHNIDENYDKAIYTCEKCKDTGYVDGKKCDCFKKKEFELYSGISNFSKITLTHNLDKIDIDIYKSQDTKSPSGLSYYDYMTEMIGKLKKSLLQYNDSPINILFDGPTGVGKTFLSKCIGAYLYSKGFTCMYIKANDYIDYFFEKNKKKLINEYDIDELTSNVDVLIFDDFGREHNTEFANSRIYNLIDKRYDSMQSTIINTHLTRENVENIYGESIASRIYNNYMRYRLYGIDLRSVKKC